MTQPPEPTVSLLERCRAEVPAPRDAPGSFCSEPFLARLDPRAAAPGTPELHGLEALLKRVTISRRLHAFYPPDVSAATRREVAAPAYAGVYCAALLAVAAQHGDFKLLNGVFVALDGGLVEPAVEDPAGELAAAARQVLDGMGTRGA
jgi:hypothetical protein